MRRERRGRGGGRVRGGERRVRGRGGGEEERMRRERKERRGEEGRGRERNYWVCMKRMGKLRENRK